MTHNKLLLSICLFFSLFHLECDAQTRSRAEKYRTIDRCRIQCVYEHYVYDPVLDRSQIEDELLEIGHTNSRYCIYARYQRDSVMAKDYPNGLPFEEYSKLGDKFGRMSLDEMIKDRAKNTITSFEHILMDHYIFEEPTPDFNWSLSDETEEICKYNCKKATSSFRGRNWTAWYTEEIPITEGPWKFGGLPGLILKVEDDKKEHIMEALQVRKHDSDISYFIRSFLIKTDREKYNEMYKEFRTNADSFLSGSPNMPKKADGSPAIGNKRLFFNPLELE